ncbi:hypothetical protein CON36_28265 [Bacillus cereus]|uniref:Uncharacterized protein n=1 Tax=Bacillus cereus TaxID=1396 RepID=A0A9X6XW94_BACCE|nr:hypothetical protein [Bacillus cereus]PDZ95449.1 hypothetical protein CON36_28265 [Bacillus cereus]
MTQHPIELLKKENPELYAIIKTIKAALNKDSSKDLENKIKDIELFSEVMEHIYVHLQSNEMFSDSQLKHPTIQKSMKRESFYELFSALHSYAVKHKCKGIDVIMQQRFANDGFNLLYKDMQIAVRNVYGVDTTIEFVNYKEKNQYVEWNESMTFSFDNFLIDSVDA